MSADPNSLVKNIVVVGGGSAGWMSAIALAARFPDKHVTVIDSSTVSPIGVGESATGLVFEFVTNPLHGLGWGDFFRRCETTFKLGIWYKDWQGIGTEYLAPIDNPWQYIQYRYPLAIEEFYAMAAADGVRLGEGQIYSHLMRSGRTDFFRNPDDTVNQKFGFASCHFDAVAFATWLAEVGVTRPNITHIDDIVEGFTQDPESGHVTAVRARSGRTIEGEFFIDCTGFHRQLLAKAYDLKWKSYSDYIRVDRAIPQQAAHAEGEPLPNHTVVTAMPHGWQWQIPTQSRMGKGYIYSSQYVSDEQAAAEFRATGVDLADAPKILRFSPGRLERQWEGNVCAVGLAGVFSEPLEATTIHGMCMQIKLLTELLLAHATAEAMPALAATYNRLTAAAYDDYTDFINFHYHTGRDDTDFWRDYQQPDAMTPTNRARLEKWKYTFPSREDFPPTHTDVTNLTTNLVIWAPMLCAFGLLAPQPRGASSRSPDTATNSRPTPNATSKSATTSLQMACRKKKRSPTSVVSRRVLAEADRRAG
ncbi:MAG: glycine/D-amino acid oxidase-like deaminating enzyme [Pirellulaceae bacterium]|jgi:glycine/D-amino acid oxidase-like deaminating enzyme